MGLLHCVTSSCAEVRYQQYKKTSGIRYRYPGEDWITVDGDDYTISLSVACNAPVDILGFISFSARRIAIDGEVIDDWDGNTKKYIVLPEIKSIENWGQDLTFLYTNDRPYYIKDVIYQRFKNRAGSSARNRGDCSTFLEDATATARVSPAYFDPPELTDVQWHIANFENVKQYLTWKIKIFKEGELVHTDTGEEEPLVKENSACQLSDRTKVIKIEKTPFLTRLEVIDFEYNVKFGFLVDSDNYGLILDKNYIPSACLNIYANPITTLPPLGGNFITNTPESGFRFIAQICSDLDCPPPRYEVICNCEEQCPDGTCPVECGNVICCYNSSTGKAVMELPAGGDS